MLLTGCLGAPLVVYRLRNDLRDVRRWAIADCRPNNRFKTPYNRPARYKRMPGSACPTLLFALPDKPAVAPTRRPEETC